MLIGQKAFSKDQLFKRHESKTNIFNIETWFCIVYCCNFATFKLFNHLFCCYSKTDQSSNMRKPRFRKQPLFNKQLSPSEMKWRFALWIFVFILIVNLLAFLNVSDKKEEEDVYKHKRIEDLIREKGKLLCLLGTRVAGFTLKLT